ncbi:MAG: hypothetical protein ABI400_14725, partial [Lacisediminihabitans sp.]
RDRLIEWQARPSRAKKLFKNDVDSWAYESSLSDQDLVHQQKAWSAQQAAASTNPVPVTPAASVSETASSIAPSLSEPEVRASSPAVSRPESSVSESSASSTPEPVKEGFFSRPVPATDVSKRITPPADDDL